MKKLTIFIIMACFIVFNLTAQQNNMVRIQGGTFTMGSPASEEGRGSIEIQRRVTVSSFYMGRYEVTKREFQEVMGRDQIDSDNLNYPAEA